MADQLNAQVATMLNVFIRLKTMSLNLGHSTLNTVGSSLYFYLIDLLFKLHFLYTIIFGLTIKSNYYM